LIKLNELQRNPVTPVKVVDDDIEDIAEVDNKLVALALQMDAAVVTNDYNLNKVAEVQGVMVLNVNALAKAVREIYIPGESFTIHIIQEGKDPGQGVGYLDDGTMVVVEGGRNFIGQEIGIVVTSVLQTPAGRMIFGRAEGRPGSGSSAELPKYTGPAPT